jgi:tRNA A-37 threonylcarbamoyl transferase component Bud32
MSYAITAETLSASPRVFEYAADGHKVVVKRYVKPDRIFVHVFQNAVARIMREPMMLRTDALGADIYNEPRKLRSLRAAGVNVPEVLYECGDYFVLEHVGDNLEDVLLSECGAARGDELIARALGRMRAMHEKNFAHGGAQIKNFTCRGGEIYMVDFEEMIPERYLDAFKRRDLIMFAMSLHTAGIPRDLDWICRAYGGESWREIMEGLKSNLRGYGFLKILDARLFSRISMKDVRAMISLIEQSDTNLKEGLIYRQGPEG